MRRGGSGASHVAPRPVEASEQETQGLKGAETLLTMMGLKAASSTKSCLAAGGKGLRREAHERAVTQEPERIEASSSEIQRPEATTKDA